MVKVLIADNDLDSHELVDDLVEINYRDVQIDRALSRESLFFRLGAKGTAYDLILFNYNVKKDEILEIIDHISNTRPELLKRIIFITSDKQHKDIPEQFTVVTRPFSLDVFGETLKKICASR